MSDPVTVPLRWGNDGPIIGTASVTYDDNDRFLGAVMIVHEPDIVKALTRGTFDAVSIASATRPNGWQAPGDWRIRP